MRFSPPAEPLAAARAALAAGIRAGERPLLVEVRSAETPPEAVVAALDVGAAGFAVDTGDPEADRRIVAEVERLDRERLDSAPLVSVIVCNYNGARYLDRCFEALARLDYPRYEVVFCDDGSTDDSVEVARRHDVRVLELGRVGLSAARNAGVEAAHGEVVVFLDGDTEADPRVLARIWRLLDRLGVEGTGGPNLPFPDAGFEELAVSGAPGGSLPLVDPDGTAILLAGCNMAFRRDAVLAAGGFDDSFPGAYDDVAFCLRMADSGARLVYHPTAAIRHHRRDSIAGFLRQQYAWGAGTPRYQAGHAGRTHAGGGVVSTRTGVDLFKPRRNELKHVFTGPQARQLFILTTAPLHVGLPAKLLAVLAALGLAGLAPAWALGRLRVWAGLCGAAGAVLFVTVAARAPAFEPPPGVRGWPQRAATGAHWFAQPLARRLGSLRARRSGVADTG